MPGVEVDHAGRRWRVHRALGPDAVLLTNDAGEIVSAAPARVELATQIAIAQPPRAPDERRYTDAQWAEAARRRDLLTELARRPRRNRTQVNDVAQELGVKRRRVYALLGSLQAGGDDVAVFLSLAPGPWSNTRARSGACSARSVSKPFCCAPSLVRKSRPTR